MLITSQEWIELSWELEQRHSLFYQLWGMGKPVFDEKCKTAAIKFDKCGNYLQFIFNPDFWATLTNYEKAFVISHECLHVILQHGIRSRNSKNFPKSNIAVDLVVNHMLERGFGFDRNQLSMDKDLCWVDTIFPNRTDIPTNQSFEYYYPLIEDSLIRESLDDHATLSDSDFGPLVEKLGEQLSSDEKEDLNGVFKGSLPGNAEATEIITIQKEPVPKKKKWETVIRNWSKQFLQEDFRDVEQWAIPNRRLSLLNGSSMMLPNEVEIQTPDSERVKVWLFQDCSGSCYHLKNRFFRAIDSIPPNRFKLRVHTFSTSVKEVDMKDRRIAVGGGTSFSIIESYIQRTIKKENLSYPDVVFVLTDGYGTFVKPEFPDRWHWFLSHWETYCIPKTSHKYSLKDYE